MAVTAHLAAARPRLRGGAQGGAAPPLHQAREILTRLADTAPAHSRWLPFGDPSRRRRIAKVASWLGVVAVAVIALELVGVDIGGWFADLGDSLTGVGFGYLVAGWALVSAQTILTALAWFYILRAGYPAAPVAYGQVLAAYATGVALNAFLPANVGTLVMMLMYVAIIPGATFAGMLGALTVQKIFFFAASAFGYVYLFASVPGTYNRQLKLPHDHPVLVGLTLLGGVLLVVLVARAFWGRLKGQWEKAKEGGAILRRPREYVVRVVLPSFGAWLAGLGVIAVFLAGYGISVSFNTAMWVSGSNSLAGSVAVTPGGVGINQAANVAALIHVTDAATANGYSLGQHLAVTAWKVLFALVLVIWAFGWSRGKALIGKSYEDAKDRADEERKEREQRRAQRRAAAGESFRSRDAGSPRGPGR